ncbi:MAG: hypothetical protein HWN80_17260 [Candidatus Lokiarchaeota archaeon]|nr:hypothetical protein [Candidatus Lokiarchaeota archaeon]
MDSNTEDLSSSLKEFDEKMTAFSSILEKFGLDIITKMGQTNLKITQLTGDVEKLNKVITKILGLGHNLDKVTKNQERVEDDLSTIKSLIMNLSFLPSKKLEVENTIERDESATDKKVVILNQLNELKANLENIDDSQAVKTILEQIKEEIFEFTGGHRMLHEISQILTILDSANSLNDLMDDDEQSPKSIKDHLEERIPFWVNKLMVKN